MRIFHVSTNLQLLTVRSLYLESLGFEVTKVADLSRAASLLKAGAEFDFALFCYSMTRRQKLAMERAVQARVQSPNRLIELWLIEPPVTGGIHRESGADFLDFAGALSKYSAIADSRKLEEAERGDALTYGPERTPYLPRTPRPSSQLRKA